MERISEGLYATPPWDPFGGGSVAARAFLLQRPAGNVAIYNATPLVRELDDLRRLGGVDRHLLSHSHEASAEAGELRDALGGIVVVHAADAGDADDLVSADETFTERHRIDDDLELLPVPGHTPGSTAFLWRGPELRVLFTGDTVYERDGRWIAAVLDGVSDRSTYVQSLEALAALEFDLLVPGFVSTDGPPAIATSPDDARERLTAIAERLRAGEDR